jgi:hypothetical protein
MLHDMRAQFGRKLEQFEVGDIYRHWPGKTITESDNNLFCLLTMNHHPVHLDVEFCKDHPHGKVLVVGTLVMSVVVGMTVSELRCSRFASPIGNRTGESSTSRRGPTTNGTKRCLHCVGGCSCPPRARSRGWHDETTQPTGATDGL